MPPRYVTRAEHERLKAENIRLLADVAALRESIREVRAELRTQFTRIAEMQAILDEERVANRRPEPRPLIRQHR
jgi:hypothetical protein